MAQRNISITHPLTWEKFEGDSESIFGKINSNFTELYLSIGGAGADLESLGSSIIPDLDETRDLGSSSKVWRSIYLKDDGLHIGDATITAVGSSIDLPLGTTVNGGPINVPDELSVNSIQISGGSVVNEFSTDGTLGDNSNTAVPTEQAVKTYVDGVVPTDVGDLTDVGNLLGAEGLASRAVVTGSTSGTLADNATGNIDLGGFKSYALLYIDADRESWVRVYPTSSARTADAARDITEDPDPSIGVIAEALVDGFTPVIISPGAIGFNGDATPTTTVYVAVTNKSGTITSINVSLTMLKLEA